MKQRRWTADEKLAIVLEGLKEERSVADICREHKISQTLYYRWRDKFLEGGKKGLINNVADDNGYKAEIERLQKIICKQAIQIIVLDWYTKKIVGWDISMRSKSSNWKEAIERAIDKEFPDGVRDKGLKLISDNGSQPTATSFMKDMATLGIEQIFTSYDNPKGNAETERMMRTIKEEIIWLNEFGSFEEAKEKVGKWI